jgi:hypothetical protein
MLSVAMWSPVSHLLYPVVDALCSCALMADDNIGPTRENLAYLKEHKICERLEVMVRHLLATRPEDPVLAMCNFVNDSNRFGFARVSLARGNRPAEHAGAASHVTHSAGVRRVESSPSSPTTGNSAANRPFPTQPAHVESRRGSLVAATTSNSRMGSAIGHAGHRLERDDSARSDVSAFSVTSVDMGEFLADFRAAHHSLFATGRSNISIDDLADIVDRIAIPIPDTSILSDLFGDMTDSTGLVPFEAFLARMNYRISGKYHIEVVRRVFFSLVQASLRDETEIAAFEKRLDNAEYLAALVEEDQAVRGHSTGHSGVAVKGSGTVTAAPSSALQRTTLSVHLSAILESIQRGIGLRMTQRDAEDLFHKMGIHMDSGVVVLHIIDVARLMALATATASHTTFHPVSSVGVDLNELSCE